MPPILAESEIISKSPCHPTWHDKAARSIVVKL
jgi:hypothetical protein